MVVQKVYCDVCKDVVTKDRTLLLIESGPLLRARQEIDLCPGCAGRLAEQLDAPAADLARPPKGAA